MAMTQARLQENFTGFDSVDPRMGRVPLDLRRPDKREEYIENHKKWFLKNHENALSDFEKAVTKQYGSEANQQYKPRARHVETQNPKLL